MFESTERSSIDQFDERVKAAISGLRAGLKSSTVVRSIADQYGVSDRQSRRYVHGARYEMWDAPGSTLELQEAVLESLEHLQSGDVSLTQVIQKPPFQLLKPLRTLRKKVVALQRDDHFSETMVKKYC